jgi:hypothetical protein
MAVPDRLGDRDPVEALRRTPTVLQGVLLAHEEAALRRRPYDGKWTPCEILGHFLDHEIVSSCRLRTLRFDAAAWLTGYAQETWVGVQRHNNGDPAAFVRHFTLLRRLNIEQYTAAGPEEWARRRPRADGGEPIDLMTFARRHANHDLHHLDQLQRYLDAAMP